LQVLFKITLADRLQKEAGMAQLPQIRHGNWVQSAISRRFFVAWFVACLCKLRLTNLSNPNILRAPIIMNYYVIGLPIAGLLLLASSLAAQTYDYRLLATSKTGTMQKEMNQAAESGFVFSSVMGGESSIGGKEVIVVMIKSSDSKSSPRAYTLLATSKTGTLQKELQQAGDEGFEYCGQTVFESAFGGREVAIILERSQSEVKRKRIEYKLLATSKTSTMEKELRQAGDEGFKFLGVVVGKTLLGGQEVISILQKTGK
jgi:hypothetical protein